MRQAIKHVALIFFACMPQKLRICIAFAQPGIVSAGHKGRPQIIGQLAQRRKLDAGIAHDAGVWRARCGILLGKIAQHDALKGLSHVELKKRDVCRLRHGQRILSGTVCPRDAQQRAAHRVSLPHQQRRRRTGVHPARKPQHHVGRTTANGLCLPQQNRGRNHAGVFFLLPVRHAGSPRANRRGSTPFRQRCQSRRWAWGRCPASCSSR